MEITLKIVLGKLIIKQIFLLFYLNYIIVFFIYRGILSTYKELCSLVTDLNRPKLLYKFIQLANYNKKKVIKLICLLNMINDFIRIFY